MVQAGVQYLQPIGFEGQLITETSRILRGALEEYYNADVVPIPYGRVVVRILNNAKGLKLPSAVTDKPAGVALMVPYNGVTQSEMLLGTDSGYPVREMLTVVTHGDILLWSEDGGTIGSQVYFRAVAGTAPKNKVGRVSKTATATDSNLVLLPGATFLATQSNPGLIPVALGGFGY